MSVITPAGACGTVAAPHAKVTASACRTAPTPAWCRRLLFRQRTWSTRAAARSWATMARPIAMMSGDDAVDALGALVLGRLEVAGGVLGDGDVGGHPAGHRVGAVREHLPCLKLLLVVMKLGTPGSLASIMSSMSSRSGSIMCAATLSGRSCSKSLSNAAPMLSTIRSRPLFTTHDVSESCIDEAIIAPSNSFDWNMP